MTCKQVFIDRHVIKVTRVTAFILGSRQREGQEVFHSVMPLAVCSQGNRTPPVTEWRKKTLGETRLSPGASSPLARILLFIYCLLIVLIKILNV